MKISGLPTFVKWAGGKTQLLPQFEKFFPDKFNNYFEPFVGSGAVFFYIKQKFNPTHAMISDSNWELINCYKAVRDHVDELIELLKEHKKNHSKNYYYEMREESPDELESVEAAARFIYLNKTCYNGLYRVNGGGRFNVPMGSYRNPKILYERILHKAWKMLQGVEIKLMDFEKVADYAKEGDFIYFDPPYMPTSKTAYFTSYTKNNFMIEDQERLAKIFRELDEDGCFLMLSNSDHVGIHELYAGYDIRKVRAIRAISCIGAKRGAINEVVIRNYNKAAPAQMTLYS